MPQEGKLIGAAVSVTIADQVTPPHAAPPELFVIHAHGLPEPGLTVCNLHINFDSLCTLCQTFKKNVAFKFGSRPFQNVVCQGLEDGLQGMRVGGQRKMTIPVSLGPPNIKLPPNIPLVYDVTLTEVFDNYL